MGRYALRTREVETGKAGDPNPDVVLATLKVEGEPVDTSDLRAQLDAPLAIEKAGPTAAEIAALPVTRQRRIVYTENAAGTEFYLDGKQFAMDRIDVEVKLGDVEEWTLVNDTDERHTFHIHQTRVSRAVGRRQPARDRWRARQRRSPRSAIRRPRSQAK